MSWPKNRRKTTAKKVQEEDKKPFVLPTVKQKPEVDETEWDKDGLTVRQRLFVEALIGKCGGHGWKAAKEAGYSDSTNDMLRVAACQLLNTPNVQRAIEKKIGQRFGSQEDIRNSVAAIANGNAADYLDIDDKGKLVVSLEKLQAAGALGLLQEIREEGFEADGKVTIVKRKLKLYDRMKALELLAKLSGMLVERHKHEGDVNVNHTHQVVVEKILNDPESLRLANDLQRRMAGHAGGDGESSN